MNILISNQNWFSGSLYGPTTLLIALVTTFGASCSKQPPTVTVQSIEPTQAVKTVPGSTAILVVDAQVGFFGPDVEKINPGFRDNMSKLLTDCRRRGIEVIHIHSSFPVDPANRIPSIQSIFGDQLPCVEGSADCEPIECAWSLPGEKVILKDTFDPFQNPQLNTYLRKQGIDHLLVCGLTTEVCVLTTCIGSTNRGYFTTLIDDCCGTANQLTAQFVVNKFRGLFFETAKSYQIPARIGVWKQRSKKYAANQS